jgi:hypothetical protein
MSWWEKGKCARVMRTFWLIPPVGGADRCEHGKWSRAQKKDVRKVMGSFLQGENVLSVVPPLNARRAWSIAMSVIPLSSS